MIKDGVQIIVFQSPINKVLLNAALFFRKVTIHFWEQSNTECPKGIKNPGKSKTKPITYFRCLKATENENTASGNPGDCAYLLRAGGCKSPASHPGTGFSEQSLTAATPLC